MSVGNGAGPVTVMDNLISGNAGNGVALAGTGATASVISGNIIGLNADGTAALPNAFGIRLSAGATGITVGGLSGNTISGNTGTGLVLDDAPGNTVSGNRIGTDLPGNAARTNGGDGIFVGLGSSSTQILDNQISGNTGNGVLISGNNVTGCMIDGNIIGLNADGTATLPNSTGVGISGGATGNIVGGPSGNTISGNTGTGIAIAGAAGNTVSGNRIGTDIPGNVARANGGDGISVGLGSSSTQILNNQISGNTGNGVFISGNDVSDCVITGNVIGLNASGTARLGNIQCGILIVDGVTNVTIGGTTPAERNVISANLAGVKMVGVGTSFNTVEGNYFGTDVTGTIGLGNILDGVVLVDGASNNTVGAPFPPLATYSPETRPE